ncbi:sensor histidine kinase [Hymenobacter guriensis]|uniref:Histidine kinase n=1 Tax=Hymenobacter guriensis TaxID=2793065 RepID=A0ABS0L7Y0_9BACT|nr:histidine kinase [Hymenobacter guriensis]MBG8555628.1 histidine kinase [Hymenobacter guriensis]
MNVTSAGTPPAVHPDNVALGRRYLNRDLPLWRTLLITTLLALLVTYGTCAECLRDSHKAWINFAHSWCYTVGLWLVNSYPQQWLNRQVDWRAQPMRRFLVSVIFSILASLAVIMLITAGSLVLFWHESLSLLLEPRVWKQFLLPLLITVVISLFLHSRSFLLEWRETSVRAERLEKENAQAQADSLRRQLDPHFLFNSLNALTSLVEENDPVRATRFIRQLSQVYRYVLDAQEQEVVPLAEEIRFVEAYLFLQRTRLGEGVQVQMDLPPAAALETLLVPPLAVQLLLENALKHNATSQRDPLQIQVTLDEAARTLTVRNQRRPRRLPEGESTGLGLQNLGARYAFLTKLPVQVVQTETEFSATLPLLELQ